MDNRTYQSRKEYMKAYMKIWRKANRDKVNASKRKWSQKHPSKNAEYDKVFRANLKTKFFEIYGSVCACCGESHIEFLTIDHINGRDSPRSHSIEWFREAIKEKDFSKFQTMCYNCNCLRRNSKQRFCKVHHPELY